MWVCSVLFTCALHRVSFCPVVKRSAFEPLAAGVPELLACDGEGPLVFPAGWDGAWAVFEEGVVVLDGLDFFGVCEGLAAGHGEWLAGAGHFVFWWVGCCVGNKGGFLILSFFSFSWGLKHKKRPCDAADAYILRVLCTTLRKDDDCDEEHAGVCGPDGPAGCGPRRAAQQVSVHACE